MSAVPGEAPKHWYLIYSKPRQEEIAVRHLTRQDYSIYLPRMLVVRRRRGRRVSRIEPMFPRYLFIQLDTVSDNWAPIRSTIGVAGLVRFSGVPAMVPDELVAAILRREDQHGIQRVPVDEFSPGGKVRFVEGPLMGYEGIFLARNSRDRVTVLLELVGRQTRLSVDPARLEKAG